MDNPEPQYLLHLNPRQKEAVLKTEGPVSVLAGAGSGKTSVLTTRAYHLIRKGIPPSKILAVTFTNKAAREMRERLERMLGVEGGRDRRPGAYGLPFIATFHGLGRELLEAYGRAIEVPRHFAIFDRDDSKRALKDALKELGIDPKEIPPAAILARISKAKGDGLTLPEFRERYGHEGFRARVATEAWAKYDETLKKEKALDFDDLLLLPVRLLEKHEDIRKEVEGRFHYLHIDEYQDTNELQAKLVALIAGERKNVFVVGDIDQSIYTWRGATIDNLLRFEETYPDAAHVVLEHNYRSTKTIVRAANEIIEKNVNRKEKRSVTDNPHGDLIRIHAADTAEAEATWVAEQIRQEMQNGTPPEEVAVLFRTNFQSRALEEAFLRERIPYRLLGTRFFDRKEVKDVLAWTRLALDPSREIDRVRAVQSPARGIGKVTLGKIAAGRLGELRPAERAKVEAFNKVVESLGEAVETLTPSAFLKLVVEKSGLETALLKEGEEGQERLENIRELGVLASRHDRTPGRDGIASFLADAALASDQDEMDRDQKKKAVTLMTVHAAKGLEFDVVFVTGMEEGLFPHEHMDEEDRDEEEERRLFYVAVTRARARLTLTLARVRQVYGTNYFSEPSSFLRDIDPSLTSVGYEDFEVEGVIEA